MDEWKIGIILACVCCAYVLYDLMCIWDQFKNVWASLLRDISVIQNLENRVNVLEQLTLEQNRRNK